MSDIESCRHLDVGSEVAGARDAKDEMISVSKAGHDRLLAFCDDLQIMLEEASTRATPAEAMVVISSCLAALTEDHPQLNKASSEFKTLLKGLDLNESQSCEHVEPLYKTG
ncbi:hypothetical protein R50073_49840 (plasmid) [Maricurvus nonylphenolicus]|uniref:hypothetical protein n=1 Tax=Maricurvus nonylphenolicus TaxID=1008307 RepID=UPI0036F1F71A